MMKLLVFGEIDGERTLVGTVETASGSEEHFRYDSVFEQRHSRAPLSVALPVQKTRLIPVQLGFFSKISCPKERPLLQWREN